VTANPPAAAAELRAALERSRGTVTELLEQLAGEPVDAAVLSQRTVPAAPGNVLTVEPGTGLLRRAALLTGRASGRRFVYAESMIVGTLLPRSVGTRLASGRDPIGRVLADRGLVTRREALADPDRPAVADEGLARLLGGTVLSRRYCIVLDGSRTFDISEWFLQATADALASPLSDHS